MLGAAWQRCRVHFLRNVLAKVPKGSAEMVAAAVRSIFAQPDAAAVADQLDAIASKLGRQFPGVEAMLRDAAPASVREARLASRHFSLTETLSVSRRTVLTSSHDRGMT
jgi:transposase-like protein